MHDLAHMKDTHTKHLSTILTFVFVFVCLDTLLQLGELTGHAGQKHFLRVLDFSKKGGFGISKTLDVLRDLCEFVKQILEPRRKMMP